MTKFRYTFGQKRNPVNDAELKTIPNAFLQIQKHRRTIKECLVEIENINDEIESAIHSAIRHGYTNTEILDTIGETLWTI